MMQVKTIIAAGTKKKFFKKEKDNYLRVSEFYYDTIQGEGIYAGTPAAFLRLQGCTLHCTYCDTSEVWKYGEPYTFPELIELMNSTMLISKLKEGQHLIITGGSPLLQQEKLIRFFIYFFSVYKFIPFIEIENEGVLMPDDRLNDFVSCWNNSPKLTSSGISERQIFNPSVIRRLSTLPNSWFKFVISSKNDWNEIVEMYLHTNLIKKDKLILMPEAKNREELLINSNLVLEIAVTHGVRYSSREHIMLWDKQTGV